MEFVAALMMLYSVLVPSKVFYTPNQPINVHIKDATEAVLELRDFDGKVLKASGDTAINAGQEVDIRALYPQVNQIGGYILCAVPKDGSAEFLGTPLAITVRGGAGMNAPAGVMVTKVEPLSYVKMTTDAGDVSIKFYYDVAPNTVDNFLALAAGGFYDGLTFHRVIPGFMIQGGDPIGDGSGVPGYTINPEFNDRPHEEGVLSMARQGDAGERSGAMPGPEAAGSAGSQFFICLDYSHTKHLDKKYTAFGKVFAGMDAVKKIAAAPAANGGTGGPAKPAVMHTLKVIPVTAKDNPYWSKAATPAK